MPESKIAAFERFIASPWLALAGSAAFGGFAMIYPDKGVLLFGIAGVLLLVAIFRHCQSLKMSGLQLISCTLLGAFVLLTVFSFTIWAPKQQGAKPTGDDKKAEVVASKIPTIHELFQKDFSGPKLSGSIPFNSEDKTKAFSIEYSIVQDFQAQSQYLCLYVKRNDWPNPSSFEICGYLATAYPEFLKRGMEGILVQMKTPGDSDPTNSSALKFTGRVYLYYEEQFTIEQMAQIISRFKANNADLQLRGSDYATTRWLQSRAK